VPEGGRDRDLAALPGRRRVGWASGVQIRSDQACSKHGVTGRLLSSAPPSEQIDARETDESRNSGVESSKGALACLSSLAEACLKDGMWSKWAGLGLPDEQDSLAGSLQPWLPIAAVLGGTRPRLAGRLVLPS